MKIVHLIDEFRIGGTQTQLLMLLEKQLAERDYEHELWCMFGDGAIGERASALGVKVVVLNLRELVNKRRLIAARKRIESELRRARPDVFEAHLTWSRLLGLWAAAREHVPIRLGFEKGDLYLSNWKFRLANYFNQRFAEAIVVPSQAHADWSQRTFGFNRERMRVLINGVDSSRFSPDRRLPREVDWPTARTLFVGAGTMGRGVNKRFDVLIKAVGEARSQGADVGLVIAGDGKMRAELQQLISDLSLDDHVRLIGLRDDVPVVMASCDAFCHAAPFEPLGNVGLEAMASGLPIVVPRAGGIQELVTEGVTGLLYQPLDHLALAAHIVSLDADPRRRQAMGKAARADAVRHEPAAYLRELDRLYHVEGAAQ